MAKSPAVKKGFITFLFSKFFEDSTNRETGNSESANKKQASYFFPTVFSRCLVPNSAWEGRTSAATFFCH